MVPTQLTEPKMSAVCPARTFTLFALFLHFALSTGLLNQHFRNHEKRPLRSGLNGERTQHLLHNGSVEARKSAVQSKRAQTENAPSSGGNRCNIELEGRFDCARDRLLSQRECEDRGCCYAPVLDSGGPPWCFYPRLYPGYQMGPFTRTKRGKTANLTRATPTYLPHDVSLLKLEVVEETAGCLHIAVSI